MVPAGNETVATPLPPRQTTKQYNRIKLGLALVSSLLSFAFLLVLVLSGASRTLAEWATRTAPPAYAALFLFAAGVGFAHTVITLPIGFVSSYVVEHRFHLSNQTFLRWAWERGKGALIGAPIGAVVLAILYFCMRTWGALWWFPVAIVLSLFSVVLARIAPTIILPLFYRLTPLEDGPLKETLLSQCMHAGLRVNGVFQFNLSKNTRKANAGFAGIGKAKRIILGDTLVQEFTNDEIETVFAHELGHYAHKHIVVGIVVGMVSTFLGLFVASYLHQWSIGALGIGALTDLAGLPLLAVWLAVFGLITAPLGNLLSRRHERQADRYAVESTGKAGAFAAALRKLAAMNLADPEPHPVVEFLFYSHPSIGKRIRSVESLSL
jgi:STE24 endopeptidase